MARLLLEAGASASAPNNAGLTAEAHMRRVGVEDQALLELLAGQDPGELGLLEVLATGGGGSTLIGCAVLAGAIAYYLVGARLAAASTPPRTLLSPTRAHVHSRPHAAQHNTN